MRIINYLYPKQLSMNNHFEDFPYSAEELSAYIFSIDTFIISLKNEEIIRHTTTQPDDFKEWLDHHNIRNVNETLGKMVYNYYFPDKKSKTKIQKSKK